MQGSQTSIVIQSPALSDGAWNSIFFLFKIEVSTESFVDDGSVLKSVVCDDSFSGFMDKNFKSFLRFLNFLGFLKTWERI